jgi:RHS repeat-associated protein
LAADNHGTAGLAVDDETLNPVKRYSAPFGAPRGPQPAGWPDDKRFLGKPADPTTGLTHVGAHEYDPGLGRFLSVDPVLDPADPQSLNGYAYAGNNPASFADPTGLFCDGCEYGGSGEHHQDTYPGRNGNDGPGSSGGGTHHQSSGGGTGCTMTAGSYPTCSGGGSAASGEGRRNSNGYCGYPASCKPLGSRDLKTWQVVALTATMALPVGLVCVPLFLECGAAAGAAATGATDAAAGGSLLAGGAGGAVGVRKLLGRKGSQEAAEGPLELLTE